jgi:hypothetical protein
MPDWLRLVLVWSIPFTLIVGGVALNVWARRRNHRRFREHPEQVPRGKRLIARIAPFATLSAVFGAYGLAIREWTVVFFAAVALASFGWQLFKASTDPHYPPAPKH